MRQLILILIPAIVVVGALGLAYKLYHTSGRENCTLENCPLELRESDSGGHFIYRVGARFSLLENENKNPIGRLHCSPEGILESRADVPDAPPGFYWSSFQAVSAGACTLANENFEAVITIVAQ